MKSYPWLNERTIENLSAENVHVGPCCSSVKQAEAGLIFHKKDGTAFPPPKLINTLDDVHNNDFIVKNIDIEGWPIKLIPTKATNSGKDQQSDDDGIIQDDLSESDYSFDLDKEHLLDTNIVTDEHSLNYPNDISMSSQITRSTEETDFVQTQYDQQKYGLFGNNAHNMEYNTNIQHATVTELTLPNTNNKTKDQGRKNSVPLGKKNLNSDEKNFLSSSGDEALFLTILSDTESENDDSDDEEGDVIIPKTEAVYALDEFGDYNLECESEENEFYEAYEETSRLSDATIINEMESPIDYDRLLEKEVYIINSDVDKGPDSESFNSESSDQSMGLNAYYKRQKEKILVKNNRKKQAQQLRDTFVEQIWLEKVEIAESDESSITLNLEFENPINDSLESIWSGENSIREELSGSSAETSSNEVYVLDNFDSDNNLEVEFMDEDTFANNPHCNTQVINDTENPNRCLGKSESETETEPEEEEDGVFEMPLFDEVLKKLGKVDNCWDVKQVQIECYFMMQMLKWRSLSNSKRVKRIQSFLLQNNLNLPEMHDELTREFTNSNNFKQFNSIFPKHREVRCFVDVVKAKKEFINKETRKNSEVESSVTEIFDENEITKTWKRLLVNNKTNGDNSEKGHYVSSAGKMYETMMGKLSMHVKRNKLL
uniref:ELM2 domain-containing protein n=1 Tax=Rhabditophanes sp. KR3021 TaxID=114890 RepID=A0AC35UCP9_9BILA